MSRYRRRRRGLFYYLKRLLILMLIVGLWHYGIKIWKILNYLDTDKIYAESSLKNRHFNKKVTKVLTKKGISAYLLEEHSIPIVSISFLFKQSGTAHEPERLSGLTHVLSDMLLNGTDTYNAMQFKDLCEENGIKIGFDADVDDFSGYLQFPVSEHKTGIKLFKEVLSAPRFDEEYMELTKKQLNTIIHLRKERPENVLNDKFSEFIFAGHPYSRPELGTSATISAIKAEDLRKFMQKHFTKENLVVGIAGDITEKEAEILLDEMFGNLNEQSETDVLSVLKLDFSGREYFVEKNSAQAVTQFVTNGTSRQNVDFYPLYLANYIFGGSGLNSRISQIIREKEGLTYGIYTYLSSNDATALLVGGFSATEDNFYKAKKLLLSEWKKMAEEGVSEKELKSAKEALVAGHNLRFASVGGIADMLVAMQKENLGIDFLEKRNAYVEAVTLKEVNAAAKKYFRTMPDFVIIGVEKKEEKQ